MRRSRIKLSESQFHRVIEESVKNILQELDYKTYANAAKKSLKRGDTAYWKDRGDAPNSAIRKAADARLRSERFGNAAKDTFNRDYGYQNGDMWDDDFADVKLGGDFESGEEFAPHVVGRKGKGYGNPAKFEHYWDDYKHRRSTPEEFFGDNTDAAQSYNDADTEFSNYRRDKYQYDKGKGWNLK